MKLLINATTCVVGGGIQVSVSFLQNLDRSNPLEAVAVVSPQVAAVLGDLQNIPVKVVASPARLKTRTARKRAILEIVNLFKPDLIFTVFGPAYISFRRTHIMGFGNGFVTHPTAISYANTPFLHRLKSKLTSMYKRSWLKATTAYIVQTETAAEGLRKIVSSSVHVVPNSVAPAFLDVNASPNGNLALLSEIHLLLLSACYPHKNMEMLPALLHELNQLDPSRKYLINCTLKVDSEPWKQLSLRAKKLGVEAQFRSSGPLNLEQCVEAYRQNHILLQSSLHETYSANYVEAMEMKRPIVATDLPFARELCGDAALFYSPLDPADAARKIVELVESPELQQRLLEEGQKMVATSKTSLELFEETVEILKQYASQKG